MTSMYYYVKIFDYFQGNTMKTNSWLSHTYITVDSFLHSIAKHKHIKGLVQNPHDHSLWIQRTTILPKFINKWLVYQHPFCLWRSIKTMLTLSRAKCICYHLYTKHFYSVQALQMINKTWSLEQLSYDTYLHKENKEKFRAQLLNPLWSSLPVIAVGCLFVYFLSWETQTWPTVCNRTD